MTRRRLPRLIYMMFEDVSFDYPKTPVTVMREPGSRAPILGPNPVLLSSSFLIISILLCAGCGLIRYQTREVEYSPVSCRVVKSASLTAYVLLRNICVYRVHIQCVNIDCDV